MVSGTRVSIFCRRSGSRRYLAQEKCILMFVILTRVQRHKSTLRKLTLRKVYLRKFLSTDNELPHAWQESMHDLAQCHSLSEITFDLIQDHTITLYLEVERRIHWPSLQEERKKRHQEYSNQVALYLLSKGKQAYPSYNLLQIDNS